MNSNALTHIVTLGEVSDNPRYEPTVNLDGTIYTSPDEAIIAGPEEYLVKILEYDPSSKSWNTVVRPQKKATVVLTQGRAVINWRSFKSDPAFGSFFERRIAATAMERDEGRKWALVCQVQAATVFTVMVGVPKGVVRRMSRVRLCFTRDGIVYAVDLDELDPNSADRLASLILRGFAQNRIETKSGLGPIELERLENVVQGRAERKFNGWAHYYDLPASTNG